MNWHWVRAKSEGVWEMAVDPDAGNRLYPRPPRYLVRCCVDEAVWSIDGQGVEVERGLVVGYQRPEYAEYMLNGHNPRKELPKAEPVHVVPGMIVCFHTESDAQWAVRVGKADPMSPTEVMEALQQYQAAVEAQQTTEDEPVFKPDLENKAAPAAPETKKAEPAKPAKAPAKKK